MDVEVALPNITAARALRTCLQDPDWRARLGFQPEGVEIETMLGASRTAIALRFVCEFGVAVVSGAAGNALYDAIKASLPAATAVNQELPDDIVIRIGGAQVPFTPAALDDALRKTHR